ncbi:MAG: suppressor of fused domain protein [Pirellula sp.]
METLMQHFDNPYHELAFSIENSDLHRAVRVLRENPELKAKIESQHTGLLSSAAVNHDLEMMRFLIDNGAPLHARLCDPFAETAGAGFVEGVQLMLDRGAMLDEEINGETICIAMRYAASKGQLDVVRFLVSRGAVINWHGRTPLTAALENNHHDVAEYLRQQGAKTLEEMKASRPPVKITVLNEEVVAKVEEFFGVSDPVALQFTVPPTTPVAIHAIRPNDRCEWLTLFTNGLSDHSMNVPAGQEEWSRAELFLQLPPDWQFEKSDDPRWGWPHLWLREIAQLPGNNNSWFGGRLCVVELPNLSPDLRFTGCLLWSQYYFESHSLGGQIITLYRVVPLTAAEIAFEKVQGTENLINAMDLVGVPKQISMDRQDAATFEG